jgi:hypothetical protein
MDQVEVMEVNKTFRTILKNGSKGIKGYIHLAATLEQEVNERDLSIVDDMIADEFQVTITLTLSF